jgi:hypothetical protein
MWIYKGATYLANHNQANKQTSKANKSKEAPAMSFEGQPDLPTDFKAGKVEDVHYGK